MQIRKELNPDKNSIFYDKLMKSKYNTLSKEIAIIRKAISRLGCDLPEFIEYHETLNTFMTEAAETVFTSEEVTDE